MADDGTLKIQVEVPGASFTTLKDLEDWLKKERKAVKDLDVSSQEFASRSKQFVTVLNEKVRVSKTLWSENAKVKDSYFVLGEELRRKTLPLMGSLGNLLESTQGGIKSIANSSVSFVQQFSRMSVEVGGAGKAMKVMVQSLLGSGGLILAISTLATMFGDKLLPKVEETKAAVAELKDVLFQLGDMSKEEHLGALVVRMNELYEKAKKLGELSWFQKLLLASGMPGLMGLAAPGPEAVQAQTEAEKARLGVRSATKDALGTSGKGKLRIFDTEAEADAAIARDKEKLDNALDGLGEKIEEEVADGMEKGAKKGEDVFLKLSAKFTSDLASGIASSFVKPLFASDGMTGAERSLSIIDSRKQKANFKKQLDERKITYEEYTLRIQQLDEQMAQQSQSAFQRIGSAFTSMGQMMLQTIAQLAAEWAALQLLQFLPLGPISAAAKVVSMAKFGGGGAPGGGTPGAVISTPSSNRSYGGGKQVIEVVSRIRGNDLVLVQAKASSARRGRIM